LFEVLTCNKYIQLIHKGGNYIQKLQFRIDFGKLYQLFQKRESAIILGIREEAEFIAEKLLPDCRHIT
jgi:hypothetical protein